MAPNGAANRRGDHALVAALAAGATAEEAARTAGVSRRTVCRRLTDPEFVRLVDEARTEMITATTARLVALCGGAVDALAELLSAESASVRLSAAKAVLDQASRWRIGGELEERLAALEADSAKPSPPARRLGIA